MKLVANLLPGRCYETIDVIGCESFTVKAALEFSSTYVVFTAVVYGPQIGWTLR